MSSLTVKHAVGGAVPSPRIAPERGEGTVPPRAIGIRVNDEPRTIAAHMTMGDLLRELGLAERKGVAVAINNSVVPRATWPTHSLADGDRVLVIRATQGG